MATQKPDFFTVITESTKITKSHSRHFLALSVLFLLPLSFSLLFFPTLQLSFTNSQSPQPEILLKTTTRYDLKNTGILIKPLFFSFLLTLALSATATITYSVYHGFFGRPVKLVYAVKSMSKSLLRMFLTFLCSQVLILGGFLSLGVIGFGVIKGIEYLGFQVLNFRGIYVIILGVLGFGVVVGLLVNWVLAPVVVVVEGSWGFEPLRRSAYLVKGMRGLVVWLLLYFGGVMGFLVWGSWESSVGSGVLRGLMFVVQTVLISALLMLLLLHSLATNTVLYMYCKAFHGELAGEIAEEFAREYVSLPFDEEKVPHVVSFVVQP